MTTGGTRILVTGATGTVGAHLLGTLAERGVAARALVRDVPRARAKLGAAAALVEGDYEDPASLRRAMDGVDALFLASANHPRQAAWETTAIDAAMRAGVRRIVKLSVLGAAAGSPVAFWDAHARIEARLWDGPVPAVVLRPAFFMTNLLAAVGTVRSAGRIFAPVADARVAMIDPRDVAAAAAAALTEPGHVGRTYTLTGPTPVSYAGLAEVMSAVVGRAVEFVDVPDAAARDGMLAAGMPAWFVENLLRVFAAIRAGVYERTSTDVVTLTGRAPRDVGAFLGERARLFGGEEMRVGRSAAA